MNLLNRSKSDMDAFMSYSYPFSNLDSQVRSFEHLSNDIR